MDASTFRQLALALPETMEAAHMGHPDFRVNKRIFATLSADEGRGVVMLTPEQQRILVDAEPRIFQPVPGGWGRKGSTQVYFESADPASVDSALTMAWRNKAPKRLITDPVS